MNPLKTFEQLPKTEQIRLKDIAKEIGYRELERNMEITKETIISAFKQAELPIDKIKKSKLGGFYVYHPFGSQYVYKKYTVVERGEGYVKKLREPIQYAVSFIDDLDLLEIAIVEAKNRKKWSQ